MKAADLPAPVAEALRRPHEALRELRRLDAEESLRGFVREFWGVLEPGRPLVGGWPLDAIAEHLEAVTAGEVKRLLINVPPGFMKSMLTDVFWPAWEWGPQNRPDLRYIGASYTEALTVRDNRRTRQLIQDELYQQLWGERFTLVADQNAKMRFDTDARGWKIATTVGGLGTGERADRFIVDDPHNVIDGESEAKRNQSLQWFTEVVPTRINDAEHSAIVVIMQRLHERDTSGLILAEELNYEHLLIPMEYEPDRAKTTSIGWRDPRTAPGELAWPERFPADYLEGELKPTLRAWGGTYAEAGQLQQRPAPRQGGVFAADQFQVVRWAQLGDVERVQTVRYWDKAGTAGGGAYTAGVKISKLADGRYLVEDVRRGQWSAAERERVIQDTAEADGAGVTIWMEQEPGSSGKDVVNLSVRALAGYAAHADRVSGQGSKEVRAQPYAAQVEIGNVLLLEAPWNREFIEEHRSFPAGRYKDQVDAAAGAFTKLAKARSTPTIGAPAGPREGNWAGL